MADAAVLNRYDDIVLIRVAALEGKWDERFGRVGGGITLCDRHGRFLDLGRVGSGIETLHYAPG